MRRPIILLIKAYQLILSPVLGPRCRFYPTCSHYSIDALAKYGFVRGSRLMIIRLLKCHPFHPGGIDLLPDTSDKKK